jgi:CheY-like chemotaxis protein
MATLTFCDAVVDAAVARRHGRNFLRRIRRRNRGRRFPYVMVVERDADGDRCHLHLLLPAPIATWVGDCWVQGWSDVERLRGKADQRAAAAYITKSVEDAEAPGAHRYECAQGFQPRVLRASADDEEGARRWVMARMGGRAPSWEWSSLDCVGWLGPPVRVLMWDG